MYKYEICYLVKEKGYDDGQWETYGYADTLEEAEESFDDMKQKMSVGDFVDDETHYIDQMAIYEADEMGTQSPIETLY